LWNAAKVRLGQFNNLPTTLPTEVTGGGRVKSQNDWMQKISFAMTFKFITQQNAPILSFTVAT